MSPALGAKRRVSGRPGVFADGGAAAGGEAIRRRGRRPRVSERPAGAAGRPEGVSALARPPEAGRLAPDDPKF